MADDLSLHTRITDDLELRVGKVSSDNLPEFIAEVESDLQRLLSRELMDRLHRRFPTARISRDANTIQLGGSIYMLSVTEAMTRTRSTLQVLLRPTGLPRSNWPKKTQQLAIAGYGRCDNAIITVPEKFSGRLDELAASTRDTYETAYAWLAEYCRGIISALSNDLAIDLYGYVRRLFASMQNPRLADLIYFGTITFEHGAVYISDQITSARIVSSVEDQHDYHGLSSIALSAQLLTKFIAYDKSFNKQAIEAGEAIDVNLLQAKYFEDHPMFVVAEPAALQTKFVTFYKLVGSDGRYLSCWFPRSVKRDVLPVLRAHLPQFETIHSRHKSKALEVLRSLSAPSGESVARLIGIFSGGFSRGWFDVG